MQIILVQAGVDSPFTDFPDHAIAFRRRSLFRKSEN
jgi:hypothetical protein